MINLIGALGESTTTSPPHAVAHSAAKTANPERQGSKRTTLISNLMIVRLAPQRNATLRLNHDEG